MKNTVLFFTLFGFVVVCTSCDTITYIPRSKTSIRREKPSILLLEKIVDFRLKLHSWPVSREDFTSKGIEYFQAFKDFKYTETEFRAIDSNTMIFYFTGHLTDIDDYNTYRVINLNIYYGRVKFFKQDGKFIWKMKMK